MVESRRSFRYYWQSLTIFSLLLIVGESAVNPKHLIPACLVCGLVGGILGQWLVSMCQKTATFDTVRVTKELVVAPEGTTEKGCRLATDGTITATGGLIANQVRGNLIVGRSLLASLNATQESLENQQIAAEITASPNAGGGLVLRSQNGLFCPSKGRATQGFETVVAFNPEGGVPSIYTQDITQGPQGRSFFVCMKPKPQAGQTAQAETPQARPEGGTSARPESHGQPSRGESTSQARAESAPLR